MRRFVLLPFLALLWTPSGAAQPYLVKDINPSFDERSSEPDRFAHFGRYAVFAASTLLEGSWSSGAPSTSGAATASPSSSGGQTAPRRGPIRSVTTTDR